MGYPFHQSSSPQMFQWLKKTHTESWQKGSVGKAQQPELGSQNPCKSGSRELTEICPLTSACAPEHPTPTTHTHIKKKKQSNTHIELYAHTCSYSNKRVAVCTRKTCIKLLKGTDTKMSICVISERQACSMTFPLPILWHCHCAISNKHASNVRQEMNLHMTADNL